MTHELLTIAAARTELAALGIVLTVAPGEYRVNHKGGKDETAYYTDDLADAVATGSAMAADAPPPPLPPLGPTGGRKSRRGFIIRHNRKLAAKRIRQAERAARDMER